MNANYKVPRELNKFKNSEHNDGTRTYVQIPWNWSGANRESNKGNKNSNRNILILFCKTDEIAL